MYNMILNCYEAIARAYSLDLKLDNDTCVAMEKVMRPKIVHWELTEARKRMAIFPYPAEIIRTNPEELWVPVVVVNNNIHILPGIPRLFERLITLLRPRFDRLVDEKGGMGRYYRVQVATKLPEGEIAPYLSGLQKQVDKKNLKIGSYPKWGATEDGTRVVVSVVGRDQDDVKHIGDQLVDQIEGRILNPLEAIDHGDAKRELP
ncbi:hypothetical protein LRAMOSA10348 [Lichtheimia ramosa]|uniref:FAD synthase middle domain-containing protein n=1 Tax=Lichtheimia ramosa TaxID=688394 RepID=A0A077WPF2_9FUNG|nr:hypothetical protein LRAMOSA10348 [Lichtheimia ramosa]